MLSGGVTPRESIPEFVQQITTGAPSPAIIGAVLFSLALLRFRKTIGQLP